MPGNSRNKKRQRTLRTLSQRTRECARGGTRAVRHGHFVKVPGHLPTRYFVAPSFVIPSCKIPTDFFLFFFQKVPRTYVAGSARANRDPNITLETRVESFRTLVGSPVGGPVGGGVGGRVSICQNLFAVRL